MTFQQADNAFMSMTPDARARVMKRYEIALKSPGGGTIHEKYIEAIETVINEIAAMQPHEVVQ